MPPIELGLDTFGDLTVGPDGRPLSPAQTLRNVVAQAELADRQHATRPHARAYGWRRPAAVGVRGRRQSRRGFRGREVGSEPPGGRGSGR